MTIRKATANDITALVLLLKGITNVFRISLGDEIIDEYIDSGFAEELINDNLHDIVIGLDNSELVGFSICKGAVIKLFMVKFNNDIKDITQCFFSMVCERLLCEYDCINISVFEEHIFPSEFFVKNGFIKKGIEFDTSEQLLRTDYFKQRS